MKTKFRVAQWRVYPYKQGSKSAKALAEALGGKVLKHVGSKFVPRAGDVVINWGSGNVPAFGPATVLNADVSCAANKLNAFEAFDGHDVRVPPWATTKEGAKGLGFPVVCRTILQGHSGAGIVIANNEAELVNAPLYTKYVKKKDEYRVHVLSDRDGDHDAFFIQRKARKLENENPNWQVRNLAGGFVFVEVPKEEVPHDVVDQAVKAIDALGLDFGGVDVLFNEAEQKAYVLECNTACGLEERTAEKYVEAIKNLIERL